jgi:hypothetical protein
MLELSQEQATLVSSALAGLPPRWRGRFEQMVRDQLAVQMLPVTNKMLQAILGNATRTVRSGSAFRVLMNRHDGRQK